MARCEHLLHAKYAEPKTRECAECVARGDTWMHLRTCLQCGHVACCDSSKNKHATAHFRATGHPAICSAQPRERWLWCFVDEQMVE